MTGYTPTKRKQKRIIEDDILSHVNNYSVDIEHREIFLFPREEYSYGAEEEMTEPGVEFSMANQFIKNLRLLSNLTDDPILIHLKSCGGDWTEGLAIYQAIKACRNHITILNYMSARSMSSVIFCAGDYRANLPYSDFMIHTGTMSFSGTGTQVETEYEQKQKADNIMYEIYLQHLRKSDKFKGWTDKKIANWLTKVMKDKEEVYFTAEECLEYNWADTIFGADGNYDWDSLVKR
jgi:ATP-dependent protease ClpP protease subunit